MKSLKDFLECREILRLLGDDICEDCSDYVGCCASAARYRKDMEKFKHQIMEDRAKGIVEFSKGSGVEGFTRWLDYSWAQSLRETCPACANFREDMLAFVAESEKNAAEFCAQKWSHLHFASLMSRKTWFSEGPKWFPEGWNPSSPKNVHEWAKTLLPE